MNSDVQVVQDVLGTSASMFIRSLLQCIIVIIILMILSPALTGMTFAGILPLVIFSQFYQKWMRDLQREIQAEKGKMNTLAEESISNVRTVKAFANESEEISKYAKGNDVVYTVGKKKALNKATFEFFTQGLLYTSMTSVVYIASLLF